MSCKVPRIVPGQQPVARPPLSLQSIVRCPRARGRGVKPGPTHATPTTDHGNAPDTAETPPHSPGQGRELDRAGQRRQKGGLGLRREK